MIYPAPIIIDASSLRNFGAIGRVDILRSHLGGLLRWVEAVESEIRDGNYDDESERRTILDHWLWLGEALRFEDGKREIETIRRALGGTKRAGEQRRHLGEAQCIYALESLFGGDGTFISDDRSALVMARKRGLYCLDTFDVLKNCFGEGLLECPEPFDLLVAMSKSRRGVRVPETHIYICP